MLYDALSYEQQMKAIAYGHKQTKDYHNHNTGEYLSGFYKNDRLIPVITVVLLLSPKSWDGPTQLHDMLDIPDSRILSLIENYKIHLIAPSQLTKDNIHKFKTSLREVLSFIKYSENPEALETLVKNNSRFAKLEINAAAVIKTCTHSAFDIPTDGKEKSFNMCKALDELCRQNRESGQENERLRNILNLMESLQLPAKKAMELLKIPQPEWERYSSLIAEKL